jgi:hypothetical protein
MHRGKTNGLRRALLGLVAVLLVAGAEGFYEKGSNVVLIRDQKQFEQQVGWLVVLFEWEKFCPGRTAHSTDLRHRV